jgi:hypothetical protein
MPDDGVTRIVFEFPASQEIYDLTKAYNEHPFVSILDVVHHLRMVRSQMLAAR